MISTVIPIQGTFDIAKGRRSIRAHIATQRWTPVFGARAGAALTALGELILHAGVSRIVAVRLYIIDTGDEAGIEFDCQLHPCNIADNGKFEQAQQRLENATDDLYLRVDKGCVQIHAGVRIAMGEQRYDAAV